jgi:hypothetical protein
MSRARRAPLLVVLVAALIATGVVSSLSKSQNPSTLPGGLAVDSHAESTALYCTGLSGVKGGVSGRVTFFNTTDATRDVMVAVVSDTGKTWTRQLAIGAQQSQSVSPSAVLAGHSYAVAAQVSGGGVVGAEVTSTNTAEAPCISTGVTQWYGAGFDTTVGSSAALSIYNPTATPAVLNVSTFSQAGFVAPAKFQGISVGAHAQVELNLGTQIVSTPNVGVHVRVVRGTLDIVGVQLSGSTVSLNPGLASASTTALFPRVTTANRASAQIRIANPGPNTADVTLDVGLPPYDIKPQTVTVRPYRSAVVSITPNHAIPAAGYAVVQLKSSEPVFSALATGRGSGVALSSPGTTQSEFLIGDFAGSGFEAAAVTNVSPQSILLRFTNLQNHSSATAQLGGGATQSIEALYPAAMHGNFVLVAASRPTLLVTLILVTAARGTAVVEPLDGR